MKIAIVHDYLMQMGGAEKVVEHLHDIFPEAPIYTSAYDARSMPDYFRTWDIRTSFLQKILMKKHTHRAALFLYPMAFESFDLSLYDVVISSSSAFAKGVVTQPSTRHICYTHTPMRFAWMTRAYMQNERINRPLKALVAPGLHYLRMWDATASQRVDRFVANSSVVARRINKFYHRDCDILFPPVDTKRFAISKHIDNYYIIVSRLAPYKRIDLAVDAFTRLGIPLKVVGTGRQMRDLKRTAGDNVEFVGHVDDLILPEMIAHARGYVMPGEEDFGIAPVEANACGRPVIAYAAGGALDTQKDGETGVLFKEQTVNCLINALLRAENLKFDPQHLREHARQFDSEVFSKEIKRILSEEIIGEKAVIRSSVQIKDTFII